MGCCKWFAVDEYAYEELSCGGDVLQEAEGGKRDTFGGFAVEQERDGGDGSGKEQEQPCEAVESVECRVAVGGDEDDVDECCGHHPDGLDGECCCGVEPHLLLEEAVNAETEGQSQRDDGEMAVVDGEIEYSGQGENQCQGLCPVEAFVEKEVAKQHIDEGVDIVAQAALEDVAVVDGPDIKAPVEGYEDAGDEKQEVLVPVLDVVSEPQVAYAHEEGDHEEAGPKHAVGEDFDAVDMVNEPPVEREEAPDCVAEDPIEQSFLVFVGRQFGEFGNC